jgi:hypothetical protein
MKKLLALPLLLLLASCNNTNTGTDGYVFGQKQYEQSSVNVNVVVYKNEQEIYKAAKVRGADYPNIIAFTVLQGNNPSTCTIHMLDPAIKYKPEFIGHEFLHCVYGQWHTNNESRG